LSVTDILQQFRLHRFHFNKQRQDVQDVQQFGRVLGEPVVGLSDADMTEAFDPPLMPADLAAMPPNLLIR
jgi:hypothetical protein